MSEIGNPEEYILQRMISPEVVKIFKRAIPLAEKRHAEFLGGEPLTKLEEELLLDLQIELNRLLGAGSWSCSPLFVVENEPPEFCGEQQKIEWRASILIKNLLLKERSSAIH